MLALQIAWAFIKKYWFIFLAIVGFVIGVVLLRRSDIDLGKLIEGINDDHQKDLESIKKKDQTIADAKKKIDVETEKKLEESDKKFDDLEKQLENQQKQRAEEILKETDSDPNELADRLAQELGSKKLD
jgi:septal ring factor EnvC (AmiA/AmiB activator)